MKDKYFFTSEDALKMIGGELNAFEIQRLISYYPSYTWAHRKCLIEDILENQSPLVMAEHKMQAKGITSPIKQSKGGHTKWASAKLRRFVRRVIYLRLRLDQGLTRIKANQTLLREYAIKSPETIEQRESLQRTIRGDTQCDLLDKK